MPTLEPTDFNIVVSVLGGWVSLFGLVSYLLKEKFYLSEALISLLAGVAFSPAAANFIRPLQYAGTQANLDDVTLYFSRLVLGVQLVLAGVQLPSRYLKQEWRPLAWLLGPIMACMWLATSLLVWGLVSPRLPFLHALVIGSCITPTDPVLSAVIVKGRFADQNVPRPLQRIIIAESGANDGLGYPFLFLPLYLIQYTGYTATADFPVPAGGVAKAIGLWFGETLGYTILLSVVYGAVVGWVAKELLYWAEQHKFVDRESFLVFAISLALFITGTCGLIGSDDILACFIAGNVFTWDDWFRQETKDDSLQPTIDMLLNVVIFMWYGAVCPWSLFLHGPVPLYRLVAIGILTLMLRRLPWIVAIRRFIPQIEDMRQAVFVGFFGPAGVSAIFYLYTTLAFLQDMSPRSVDSGDGTPAPLRPDIATLGDTTTVVIWFFSICSIVVHGLSIPLGKLGFYLPRTLSRALPSSPSSASLGAAGSAGVGDGTRGRYPSLPPFLLGGRVSTVGLRRSAPSASASASASASRATSSTRGRTADAGTGQEERAIVLVAGVDAKDKSPATPSVQDVDNGGLPRPIYRIGGSIIPPRESRSDGTSSRHRRLAEDIESGSDREAPVSKNAQKLPADAPQLGQQQTQAGQKQVPEQADLPKPLATSLPPTPPAGSSTPQLGRTIRFPDDPPRPGDA